VALLKLFDADSLYGSILQTGSGSVIHWFKTITEV